MKKQFLITIKKALLISSLFISLNSHSQEPLLEVSGEIFNAKDSVRCTLYYFDQDSITWIPAQTKMYKEKFSIDFFFKEELYALEFFNPDTYQSNCLLILTGNKSRQTVNVHFDTDPEQIKDKYGLLFNRKGTKDDYKTATIL